MKRWLASQLEALQGTGRALGIILDPSGVLEESDLEPLGDVRVVHEGFALRRIYEWEGRNRQCREPLVVLLQSPDFPDPRALPFDVECTASVVVVGVPGPSTLRSLLLELDDERSDVAVEAIARGSGDPLGPVLAAVWGVSLPAPGDSKAELEFILRLQSDATAPAALWPIVAPLIRTEIASALAQDPPDCSLLQQTWDDWLASGEESSAAVLLRGIGSSITPMFLNGLLRPAAAEAQGLPAWSRIGAGTITAHERVESLLAEPRSLDKVSGLRDWIDVAHWWARVRAGASELSQTDDELLGRAWQYWSQMDQLFVEWLKGGGFGLALSSSFAIPSTVNKIQKFLARRIREGLAHRVLLVVLDGMGMTHWEMLREATGLRVVTPGASMAMLPTLTNISRQAIFAGAVPAAFAESLGTTAKERHWWREAWRSEELDVSGVRYHHTKGAEVGDVPDLSSGVALGMVVTAVDEMIHGSHVLGDGQVAVQVKHWAERGFIRTLVERAAAEGFEVWFTADHGNIEAIATGKVMEGLVADTAGTRVRIYPNETLRDARNADGEAWDPPGLPDEGWFPLFASGRGGYFSGDRRVTHGGWSIDEVIVPMVQVAP